MSDGTPTEREVRERFIDGFPMDTWIESRTTVGAEFDRWLAEHDRQTAGRAWDEGFDAYEADHLHHDNHGWGDENCLTVTHNPYRKEQSDEH